MTAARNPSVSARRWESRLTPAERERLLLDTLERLGGWADVATIRRAATRDGLRVATGTTRSILDRLADAGRCERQVSGTSATFRAKGPPA